MKLQHDILKSSSYVFVARMLSAVLGFFLSIIVARVLQPYEFGLYAFAISAAALFITFSDFGISTTMVRFVSNFQSKKQYGKAKSVLYFMTKYKLLLVFSIGLLMCLFSSQIASNFYNKPELTLMTFLAGFILITQTLFTYSLNIFRALKDFRASAISDVAHAILKIVFVVSLAVIGFQAYGAVVGLIISYAAVMIYVIYYVSKKHGDILGAKKSHVDVKILRKFTFWAGITTILIALVNSIDKTIISIFLPIQNVGFYSIGLTWASALTVATPITSFVLFPYFSLHVSGKTLSSMLQKSIKYGIMSILPLAAVVSLFSPSIIPILYKSSYDAAIPVLSILVLSSVLYVLNGIFNVFFESVKRPDIVSKIYLIIIALNIILDYVVVVPFGITGVAYVCLSLTILQFIALYIIAVYKNMTKFKLLDMLKPIIACTIACYAFSFFQTAVTIFRLCVYGVSFFAIYFLVMFVIKGIVKDDVVSILDIVRKR